MLLNIFAILIFLCCTVNALSNDRYFPRYHLAPPKGWMNDPNGFSVFKKEYHLFYQYNPYSSLQPGIAHWGHAKSKDLFHWEDLGIAMSPDKWYDKSGVFSGSAIVEGDTMYFFYTGNINNPGQNPDHENCQALATSKDGVNFTKYDGNPLINGSKTEPNLRDPKVWKHGNTYYMVLGNAFKNSKGEDTGRVLLYASKDKIHWDRVSVLAQSDGTMGYMWECPDFFQLGGLYVLLFSPQGVKPYGDKYNNLYQTGYILGHFDYFTHSFRPVTGFREIDHGHDFYATQTLINKKGERIMVGWFDMWETNYPEQGDGFTGQMTMPRRLSLSRRGEIVQTPVREIEAARGRVKHLSRGRRNTAVVLNDNAGEIKVIASPYYNFNMYLESRNQSKTVTISYDAMNGQVSLIRGTSDIRRTNWRPFSLMKWTIYVDSSSIELFCGDGEVTFSSRFFPDGPVRIRVGEMNDAYALKVTNMKRTVYLNGTK